MKQYAVGIDLGGTNIKGGLVRRDGSVVLRESIKTEVQNGPDHVVSRIAMLTRKLIADGGVSVGDVAAVCVGSPGPLDSSQGIVHEAPNLGWVNLPLAAKLRRELNMEVFVENDANVAGFGEAWAGAARDAKCALILTLGTGVGGGIVINGQLWRGVADTAGELGHLTIDYNGRLCTCGNKGCIEAYASATGVAARFKEAVLAGRESSLKKDIIAGKEVDAEAIHVAAVAGDELSREIFEETGKYLGIAVASFVNIFNPDYIVLHGGMVNAGEMLFAPLRKEMHWRCFKSSQRNLHIFPSELGGNAGIIGAAGLAFQRAEVK